LGLEQINIETEVPNNLEDFNLANEKFEVKEQNF